MIDTLCFAGSRCRVPAKLFFGRESPFVYSVQKNMENLFVSVVFATLTNVLV